MTWKLKGCERCGGDQYHEDDGRASRWVCAQCGRSTLWDFALPPRVNVKPSESRHMTPKPYFTVARQIS